jgi:hypothetical protein
MVKKITIVWLIIAAIIAIYTTITQDWPASMVIDWTAINGKYYIKLTVVLTWVLLMAPVVIPIYIFGLITARNRVPADLTGRSGIIVHRIRALQDAAYPFTILTDDEIKEKVSNGKSTFVDLKPGSYQLVVKSGRNSSAPITIQVEVSKISKYTITVNPYASSKVFGKKEGFLTVTPA